MGKLRAGLRKRAMTYLWRAQQSGAIISISLLGTLTAASLYNDYLRQRFHNYAPLLDENNVLGGVLLTMAMIFAAIFLVGFLFDRLKFWKEQNIVAIERNPYGSYKLTAKEIYWIRMWIAAVSAGNPTPAHKEMVTFVEQWIRRSTEEDPILKAEISAVEKWVLSGDQAAKRELEGDA
jgi:hypothetical protein